MLHARDLLPERLCGWGFPGFQALVLFFGRVVSRARRRVRPVYVFQQHPIL